MRVTVNLSDELVKFIDEEAARLNISRSAFICVCCSSDMNAYYRHYNEELARETFVEKMAESESVAKLLGKAFDKELNET